MAKINRPRSGPPEELTGEQESVEQEIERLQDEIQYEAIRYAGADRNEKQAKKIKEAAKKLFNDKANRLIELTRPLSKRTVSASVKDDLIDGFGVQEWVETNYPGYRVVSIHPDSDQLTADIVLEEDPKYLKYSVRVGDEVVGRTVSHDYDFDAERFFLDAAGEMELEDGWALAKAFIKPREVVEYEIDEELMEQLSSKNPELLAMIQQYTALEIKPKMTPVRKANEDD